MVLIEIKYSDMKNIFLIVLLLFPVTFQLSGQQIFDIKVEPRQSELINVARSNCEECGKLIFISFVSNLQFVSDWDNIKQQWVDVEVVNAGREKFTYHVVTKALPQQLITIKGPTIASKVLEVRNLEPGTHQEYLINYIIDKQPVTESMGSFNLNSVPQGASIIIGNEPNFKEVTPFLIKNHPTGTFNVKLDKADYDRVDTTITIIANQTSEMTVNLKPSYTPLPTTPTDQNLILQNGIKKHGRNQVIWLGSTILAAGTGGYFMIAADKKYKEYLASTDSHANELHKTVVRYDKLGPVFMGIAAVCAVEFTIQTVKKNKDNKQLKLYLNGQGAKFTYNF
jgi:hypothetical protein